MIDGEVSGVTAIAEIGLAAADDGRDTEVWFAMEISASGMTRLMEPMIASAVGAFSRGLQSEPPVEGSRASRSSGSAR